MAAAVSDGCSGGGAIAGSLPSGIRCGGRAMGQGLWNSEEETRRRAGDCRHCQSFIDTVKESGYVHCPRWRSPERF